MPSSPDAIGVAGAADPAPAQSQPAIRLAETSIYQQRALSGAERMTMKPERATAQLKSGTILHRVAPEGLKKHLAL